jgi:outer membrane immunogenic protein
MMHFPVMRALLATAICSPFVFGAPAAAADFPSQPVFKAPPVPAATDWTGFHLGALAGYGWGGASTADVQDFDRDPHGGFAGLVVGYDYQFANRVVAGLQVDASLAMLADDAAVVHTNTSSRITDLSEFKVRSFGTVRGRIGYAFDRVLPYATGGFAWARTRLDYSQPMDLVGSYYTNISDAHVAKTRAGWAVGGGVEYLVAPHWSAKLEYLYMNFGRSAYPALFWPAVAAVPFDIDTTLTLHTIKMALAYRF